MAKNYLKASAKVVSTLAGPFGAPLEGILSLYEDELTDQREAQLDAMLAEGQNLTRESLDAIFETKGEIKELREQFIVAMKVCLTILQQNNELLTNSQKLENNFPPLIEQHQKELEDSGFVTEEVLTNELSKLYATSPDLFLTTIGAAGFPLETIPHGKPPKVIVFQFLNRCFSLELNQQVKIFNALRKENRNSKHLRAVTSLLRERLSNQI